MLELLRTAMKGGFRSSEFWLAAAAVVLPIASDQAAKLHGTAATIATAAVAAAYAVSRGYVKGKGIEAAAQAAASESALNIGDARADSGRGLTSARP
jgi:hypothetical protein